MTRQLKPVVTGANALIRLGDDAAPSGDESGAANNILAYCTGVTVNEGFEEAPVKVHGVVHSIGHVTTDHNCSGSIQVLRLVERKFRDVQMTPVEGLPKRRVYADPRNLQEVYARLNGCILQVLEKTTSKVILQVAGFKPTTKGSNIGRALVFEDVQFVGTYIVDGDDAAVQISTGS